MSCCTIILTLFFFQTLSVDSFPGLWEVPLVDYIDLNGKLCNFVESCTLPKTATETYELFNTNFQRHYTTNRAPFYMLLEEQWLANGTYYKGRFQVKAGRLFQKAKKELSTSSFRRPTSYFRHPLPISDDEFSTRKSRISS